MDREREQKKCVLKQFNPTIWRYFIVYCFICICFVFVFSLFLFCGVNFCTKTIHIRSFSLIYKKKSLSVFSFNIIIIFCSLYFILLILYTSNASYFPFDMISECKFRPHLVRFVCFGFNICQIQNCLPLTVKSRPNTNFK